MTIKSPMHRLMLMRIALQDSANARHEDGTAMAAQFSELCSLPVSAEKQFGTSPRMTVQTRLRTVSVCTPKETATEVVEEGCAIPVRDY